jgi:hypothetical protein
MSHLVNWREWLEPYEPERGFVLFGKAIEGLLADEKVTAVWASGSRAINRADSFSDLDLRIHARNWSAEDFSLWVEKTNSMQRPLVRLSKLGASVWNYECLFAENIPVDLLVFSGDAPSISFDSVIFKMTEPLSCQQVLRLVKEEPFTSDDIRNLMDGFLIDHQKFTKLLARKEALPVFFLIESQRLALLRLAYLATRGVDCGARNQHTLASIKLVESKILNEAKPQIVDAILALEKDRSCSEEIACLANAGEVIFGALRQRFSIIPDA